MTRIAYGRRKEGNPAREVPAACLTREGWPGGGAGGSGHMVLMQWISDANVELPGLWNERAS
jgi:hypothetical protein